MSDAPLLDPQPVGFDAPMETIEGHIALEFDDGRVGVLTTEGGKATLWSPRYVSPSSVEFAKGAEVGDVVSALTSYEVRRAFQIPAGRILPASNLAGTAVGVMLGVIGVLVVGGVILAQHRNPGISLWLSNLIGLAGIYVAVFGGIVAAGSQDRLGGWQPSPHALEIGGQAINFQHLLDERPALKQAERHVADVKETYGRLLIDVIYRIENPALFDAAVPTTAEFTSALIAWDNREGLNPAEISTLAAEVERTFAVAKAHAETVGMAHLGEARGQAETALKAFRVTQDKAASPAEKKAALDRAIAVLDSLMLYYLPRPTEVEALMTGTTPPALPGRIPHGEQP